MEFSSKLCKINNHKQCPGQWEGFGFQIFCNCDCHRNVVLGRVESRPNTNLLSNRSSKEDEL